MTVFGYSWIVTNPGSPENSGRSVRARHDFYGLSQWPAKSRGRQGEEDFGNSLSGRKDAGEPAFYEKGAPRMAIMQQCASECIEGSES